VKFDAPLCETIIETPKPSAKEVLVRIERCGLCHSDLHIQDGYADLGGGKKLDTTRGMTLPFTLGHEIAGVVEEVGADVSKELIGAKKAVFPWIGCGQCRDCLNGDENLCVKQRFLGVAIDGGFASHVLQHLATTGLLDHGLKVRPMVLPDRFIEQGSPAHQYEWAGLDAAHIVGTALAALGQPAERARG